MFSNIIFLELLIQNKNFKKLFIDLFNKVKMEQFTPNLYSYIFNLKLLINYFIHSFENIIIFGGYRQKALLSSRIIL